MSNISKGKRDQMLKVLRTLRETNIENPEILQTLGEIEYELTHKKYGLVWEHHSETVDEALKISIPVFTEVKDREIQDDLTNEKFNFLLEGDNLQSLYLLEKTHKEKIDVIYIDPPYNTGNKDFIYDDRIVDNTDTFRHSKWLSFMQARLRIARSLLNSKGVIFISIDDNEQAALKLLCDEILGEQNFINCFVWKRNSSGKTEKTKFTVNTEYILLYGKSSSYVLNDVYKPLSESSLKLYNKDDGDGRGRYQSVSLQKPKNPGPETTYDYVDNNGKVWKCPKKGWRMVKSKIKDLENDNRLILTGSTLRVKDYWNERPNSGKRVDTLWNDLPENTKGSAQLEDVFSKSIEFNNPKPIELIKRCIGVATKNALVLDFFAGSGTTGQAVLALNKEDGGHRQFILCTNNQNEICEKVTYERLARVSRGNEKVEALPCNLKYYKTEFVEKSSWTLREDLLKHTLEMIELECGHKVLIPSKEIKRARIVALFIDEDAEALQENWEIINPEIVYLAEDSVLLDAKQEKLLKMVKIIPIPEDYFYFELNNEEV